MRYVLCMYVHVGSTANNIDCIPAPKRNPLFNATTRYLLHLMYCLYVVLQYCAEPSFYYFFVLLPATCLSVPINFLFDF